jgi:hypothetical protein
MQELWTTGLYGFLGNFWGSLTLPPRVAAGMGRLGGW